jgi:hypothetical protein
VVHAAASESTVPSLVHKRNRSLPFITLMRPIALSIGVGKSIPTIISTGSPRVQAMACRKVYVVRSHAMKSAGPPATMKNSTKGATATIAV